jgi:CDP-diacylglycerol--serine O-phosphatidyltransferase
MIVFLPVYVEFVGAPHGLYTTPIVILYTLFVAMLLVSRFPTWSSKLIGRRIPRDWVLPLFVVVVLVVGFLASFPWHTMTVLSLVYLASLPLSWRAYQRRLAADEVAAATPAREGGASPPPSAGDDVPKRDQ